MAESDKCAQELLQAKLLEESDKCAQELLQAKLLEESDKCAQELLQAKLLEESDKCAQDIHGVVDVYMHAVVDVMYSNQVGPFSLELLCRKNSVIEQLLSQVSWCQLT